MSVYQWKLYTGQVAKPHVLIRPGMKESMSGHKTGYTATGCVGTVSWVIGSTGKMLVVMYSVPYDHNFHSNWCGAGIFKTGDTSNHYKLMYYNAESGFKRKEFYRNVDPVVYEDSDFTVSPSQI